MATFKPEPDTGNPLLINAQKGNQFLQFWDTDIGPKFLAKPTGSDKWMPAKMYPERMFNLPGRKLEDEEAQRIIGKAKEDYQQLMEEVDGDKEKLVQRTEEILSKTL